MRRADWLIGFFIAVLVLGAMYYFVKTYKTIQNQQPDRPPVEQRLDEIGGEETGGLDGEDMYEEESYPEEMDTTVYVPEEPTIDDLADLQTDDEAKGETTPLSYDSASEKKFLVVAGTFTQMINAEKELKKFRRLGFNDAEIGKFNNSAYASLIVDRFSSNSAANRLVQTLKNEHRIEAYVHKKR